MNVTELLLRVNDIASKIYPVSYERSAESSQMAVSNVLKALELCYADNLTEMLYEAEQSIVRLSIAKKALNIEKRK